MRLCIECKYCHVSTKIDNIRLCSHPDILSPVDGNPYRYCLTEREIGKCGKEGKHWEPIE